MSYYTMFSSSFSSSCGGACSSSQCTCVNRIRNPNHKLTEKELAIAKEAETYIRTGFTSIEALERYLKKYDLIQVKDKFHIAGMFYSHWAIFIGDGMIVHLVSDDGNYEIKREDISVLSGCNVRKNNYLDDEDDIEKQNDAKIEEAINEVIGETGKYDINGNNCEHYATWFRYGVRLSFQTFSVEESGLGWFRSRKIILRERCDNLRAMSRRYVTNVFS